MRKWITTFPSPMISGTTLRIFPGLESGYTEIEILVYPVHFEGVHFERCILH